MRGRGSIILPVEFNKHFLTAQVPSISGVIQTWVIIPCQQAMPKKSF
jgi:hypothetical protein